MTPLPIATVLLLRADVVRALPANFMWSFCTIRHGPRSLAARAVAAARPSSPKVRRRLDLGIGALIAFGCMKPLGPARSA